jgi:hypothetical protein
MGRTEMLQGVRQMRFEGPLERLLTSSLPRKRARAIIGAVISFLAWRRRLFIPSRF